MTIENNTVNNAERIIDDFRQRGYSANYNHTCGSVQVKVFNCDTFDHKALITEILDYYNDLNMAIWLPANRDNVHTVVYNIITMEE